LGFLERVDNRVSYSYVSDVESD